MLKFLVFVVLFAVAVYIVVRLSQQRGGGRTLPRKRPAPPPPPRVLGPDDDDDFLRDLDRKRLNPEDPESP